MRTLESYFQEVVARERLEAPTFEAETETSPPHEGLVIEEIEMKRFMRYLSPTSPPITFPEKFTAITGLTGAGKTSILDAITFALYKRSTRTDLQEVKISDICLPGGFVRVEFRQGGHSYEVTRGFSSKGAPYLELKKEGKPLRGTIPELETIIQDIVGLDYEGFRNSTFVRQEEMKQLGAESPAQRLEVFQKLFRLETFEKAAEVAKGRWDEVRGQLQELEGELSVLREQVQSLDVRREEAQRLEAQVGEQRKTLAEAEDRLKLEERAFRELERGHDTYIKALTLAERLRQELASLEEQLEGKRELLGRKDDLEARLGDLTKEVKALRASQKKAQGLSEASKGYALALKELEAFQDRLKDLEDSQENIVRELEAKVSEEEARLRGLGATMGVEEAFDTLRKEGALEERLRRIEKELEWLADRAHLVKDLEEERGASREFLDSLRGKVGGINRDVFVYSEIEERLEELKRDLVTKQQEGRERRSDLEARLEGLNEQVKAIDFGPEEEKQLQELQRALEGLSEKEETLLAARGEMQRLEDLEEQVLEGEVQREQMKEALKEATDGTAEAEGVEAAFQEAKEALERWRKERDDATKVLYKSEGALKAALERVEELEGLSRRLQESDSRAEELRARSEVYAVLRDGVFHRKGVVMYAINRLLPALEIEASRNLDDLTNGRLTHVKLDTHEEAQRYGIRIQVEGVDGEWHDVGIFSGGERTQINAALRFAIAKELASMPQVGRTYGRMKTLFIDEGDLGSLDTETSRELFVAKLFKMGEFFEKVILITHLGEVAERFPGRVRVHMNQKGESTAEVVA